MVLRFQAAAWATTEVNHLIISDINWVVLEPSQEKEKKKL
jgi:hypothetical protein